MYSVRITLHDLDDFFSVPTPERSRRKELRRRAERSRIASARRKDELRPDAPLSFLLRPSLFATSSSSNGARTARRGVREGEKEPADASGLMLRADP